MSANNSVNDVAKTAQPAALPSSPPNSSSGSMIDSRNTYKVSPVKTMLANQQQQQQSQDIVKIRLTKDESGKGLGYTKSIITGPPPPSLQSPPSDKTDNKPSPPKLSINLAQQPTLQLKTAQNKIVLVKMLPKMPPSGPQVVPAPSTPVASRSNLSPTTLALARGVQGLRPIPPVTSPPSATLTSGPTGAGKTPDKKEPEPVTSVSSSVSLTSSNLTLTTTLSTTSTSTPCKSEMLEEPQLESSTTEDVDVDNDSINTSSVKMSREMRCLKASQSNSKILSEFMQDSSSADKLRKRHRSRCEGEDSRSCGSVTPTSLKRYSLSGRDEEDLDDSKGSPSLGTKRTGMRSANVEFSLKQRKFLHSIHQHSDGSDGSDNEAAAGPDGDETAGGDESKEEKGEVTAGTTSLVPVAPRAGYDKFCWRCKTSEPGLETCAGCIRCFHPVCLKLNPAFFIVEKKWNCPECIKLQPASDEPAKDRLKIDSLTVSLKFALKRMQMLKGSNLFNPLEKQQFPHYDEYVTNHMDLEMVQKSVAERKYRTTEEFIADVSWMLHNASIYPNNNKLLPIAKAVVKVCKQEMNEIEACNECYFNANTCKLWFTEVCTKPHLLVWAKLKGFPFWPAKLMSVNSNQLVDVRFFGDHDRAWVPIKECLLFCEKDPNTKMQRRTNMAECMREAETYIGKLKRKFGQFRYAEFRTQVEASRLEQHLEAMIPGVLKRISENEDSQKTKLMLRIIKTADNFLSISPLSESPPSTSTPKADKAANETSSPKRKCTEKTTGTPKSEDTSAIKEEVRNSMSTPEPSENPATRTTRKRKRSGSFDEPPKPKDPSEKLSWDNRRRSSRATSTVLNKTKEDDRSGAATPEPNGPRCYANSSRKRQSESPLPEPKQDKVESVVIQRKSDSWKTVPAGKKQKINSKSSEEAAEVKEDVPPAPTDVTPKQTEESVAEAAKQPETTSEPASKEAEKTSTESEKPASVAPVPMAPTEIKTEIVDEESVVEKAVVEPPPAEKVVVAEPSRKETTTSVVPLSTTESTPHQLLPIKLEPLSDDESEPQVIPSASGASHQPLNPNQVVIRTGNRIMVKDITRMTTTQITARSGQPVILTPVDKPKGLLAKVMPKVLPAGVAAQQKMRRSFPTNQPQQSTIATLSLNRTNPGGSMPSSSTSGPARNGNNMMHMVHIPSPLPTASDHHPVTANGAGAANSQPPSTRPTAQQTSNCDTTLSDGATASTSATAGPSSSTTTAAGTSNPTPTTPDDSQHMMAGFITPSLAAAVTETIVSTPPKLQSRPSGALRSEGDCVYPSGAGPVSKILINNSYKMADFFRSVIEDTLADLSNNSGALEAKVKVLELEIEKLKHCHQQEISKLKHNSDLVLCEMRKNMDLEKTRLINEIRKQCDMERIRSVEEAKKKQWCVNCGKEALFYCCWNTSYCDYPCQQQHWATHMNQCTQSQFNLPSTAIANKPQQNMLNSKLMAAQQITTPKITTVQTLNLNGRSGLTIQPAQQHSQQQQQQQQLIITSARGGAQLGKGQTFQRLMINPGGSSSGGGNNTIVSSAPSNSNKWITSICSAATSLTVASIGTPPTSVPPTPVGIMASSSVVAAAVQGGNLGRPPSTRLYKEV
uniref:Protein kinase C-binding protein 1 n=1 Tax=Culex pipiens TaxID=7175 RepID=A0A8D8CAC1_CULPI